MAMAEPQIVGNPSLLTSPERKGKASEADKASDGMERGRRQESSGTGKDAEGRKIVEQVAPLTTPSWLWGAGLVAFCAWDIVASFTLACVSFSYAYRDDGVSLYCLSIQAISHMSSSFVLVLRFLGDLLPARDDNSPVTDDELIHARRRRDLKREQVLVITMAITMLLSCAALLFKAFRKIKFWDLWYFDHTDQDMEIERVTDLIAWCGFGGYVIQFAMRVLCARHLRKSIIWHASAVSAVCLLFFCVLAVAASYEREWSWKAEPLAAIVLVFVMACEAIRMVIGFIGDTDAQLECDPHA